MNDTPHQFIPIIKIISQSQKYQDDDIVKLCENYGKVGRIKALPQQENHYYISFETVEYAHAAFYGLKENKDLIVCRP
ncbi:hypothetical protein KM1_314760 [Entamoeba histolytica HM-3:IMSS]|uniref:Vacuolar protein sorting protein n=3 Tax=Entamoeba TaxID=5758 RepID=A0A175JS78_ENTHI|nr:hypothetical protein KM1_314760 [Entamoeba histolytica HM-3:IMSS]GAT96591.1 vacuolar protein sorting protein [Entamoeba histolytica]